MKKGQIIGIVIVAIVLIIIIVVIAMNAKTKTNIIGGGSSTTTSPNILDTILSIFKPKPKEEIKYCDCSKPGFASDGAADVNCNQGGLFYSQDC